MRRQQRNKTETHLHHSFQPVGSRPFLLAAGMSVQTQWRIVAPPSSPQPVSNIKKSSFNTEHSTLKIYAAHVYVYSAREQRRTALVASLTLCILAYIMYSNLLCKLLKVHYITLQLLFSKLLQFPVWLKYPFLSSKLISYLLCACTKNHWSHGHEKGGAIMWSRPPNSNTSIRRSSAHRLSIDLVKMHLAKFIHNFFRVKSDKSEPYPGTT